MAREKNISLTKREHEILTIVARGYTRAEIGKQLNISAGTVGNHINNIYKKLEVGSNTQAVFPSHENGYYIGANSVRDKADKVDRADRLERLSHARD